jgi:hypothetical protein
LTFPTTKGAFTLTAVSGDSTFTASTNVAAVPEPSNFLFGGFAGMMGIVYALRRRKAKAA